MTLSVLALSSRFDGLFSAPSVCTRASFQYSLCRVVLMVLGMRQSAEEEETFSTRSVESF